MALPMSRSRAGDADPMVDMNTTPLIDVMLVLLIMFIITIPLQSHAVKIALPQTAHLPDVDPTRNRVTLLEGGGVRWNDAAVTDRELVALLAQARSLPAEPETQFAPAEGARYARVDELLALMSGTGITRLGFVGNERYAAAF